jgi:hypothetical protein
MNLVVLFTQAHHESGFSTTQLINVPPLLKELQFKIFLALLQETRRDRT